MGLSCINFHIPMFTLMALAFLMCFLMRNSQGGQKGMSPHSWKYRVSPLFTSAPQSWQTLLFIMWNPPTWRVQRRTRRKIFASLQDDINPWGQNIFLAWVDFTIPVTFHEPEPAEIRKNHVPGIGWTFGPDFAKAHSSIEKLSSPSSIWVSALYSILFAGAFATFELEKPVTTGVIWSEAQSFVFFYMFLIIGNIHDIHAAAKPTLGATTDPLEEMDLALKGYPGHRHKITMAVP